MKQNEKTAEKIAKIKALCIELQMTLSPENALLDTGLIKPIIYYIDNEQYPPENTSEKAEPEVVVPEVIKEGEVISN